MPPAGYPAFLQYLQSGRVRKNEKRHRQCDALQVSDFFYVTRTQVY